MDTAIRAWLISQLGTATDLADLASRYTRLGNARAVALEVLNERLAALRSQASTVNLSGAVSVSFTENIKSYERQIAALEAGGSPAPDDPVPAEVETDDDPDVFGIVYFTAMDRR